MCYNSSYSDFIPFTYPCRLLGVIIISCQPQREGWLIMYLVVSVCLFVIISCKQDIWNLFIDLCIICSRHCIHTAVEKWLIFGADHIQDGWLSVTLVSVISKIVNYLGQVRTEVKGDKERLVYYCYWVSAVIFCIFCEQIIDYSMSDENLTLQSVKTWTVVALKEYVKKRGMSVTGSKKLLAASVLTWPR